MMRWFLLLLILVSCRCGPVCQDYRDRERAWYDDNGKLKVLATTAMIDGLVKRVGGAHIDALVLIRGELDPHSYQLVKGDGEKFSHADVIFFSGLGLEHGASLRKQLAENPHAVGLGDELVKRDDSFILHYKGQVDPHIWMDVSLWKKTVPIIVETLSKEDPDHAVAYKKNGDQLMQDMDSLHQSMVKKLHAIPSNKRYLVTSHDAFNYFARAYLADPNEKEWRDRFQAPEGLAPESQISTTDIQAIIDHMQKHDIHVIFPESNVSRDSIRKIVQAGGEKGLHLKIATVYLYGDAMGEVGSDGDNYFKMLEHNANTIAEYLTDHHE